MPQLQSAVVYDGLPISSGGAHAVNRLGPQQALATWRSFLASCTEADPAEAFFRIDKDVPGLHADRRLVRTIKEAFPERHEAFSDRYAVPPSRLDEAIGLFERISPLPTDSWGNAPVWLHLDARFRLARPGGDGLWPGQDPERFGRFQTPAGADLGASSTRLYLSGRISMGLLLTVPEASDDDIAALRPWLQSHLPFRMSSKHWVRWTLNKNGRTYRPRRLDLG